jgi:hypothetical protein
MKRTLPPTWTPEEIAAGDRVARAWMDFFGGGTGPPALETPAAFGGEAGRMAAVRGRHEARLLAYPNVVGVTEGKRMRRGKPAAESAIVVLVSRKVPRRSLTRASLLPSQLEGVPVDVVEVGPVEALGAEAGKARAKARAVSRVRRKRTARH